MTKKAYTLIEVLVVIIIMAMIFTGWIPSFSRFLQSTRLDVTAREITSTLRIARSYAITRNGDYAVKFEGSGAGFTGKYWIEDSLGNVVDNKLAVQQTIIIDDVTFTNDEVKFKPTGGAYHLGTIILKDTQVPAGEKKIKVINATGRVQIQ